MSQTVTIKILDKDYQVACPPEQRDELRKAADYLDEQMRAIRGNGRIQAGDRIAIMAGLNITHEMLYGERPGEGMSPQMKEQMATLNDKLDDAIEHFTEVTSSYKAVRKKKA